VAAITDLMKTKTTARIVSVMDGEREKDTNTRIQPLAISNWQLATTAFCRLEVSPSLGLKANC